ncbi:hypothetical protein RYX56_00895 [Alkalihalophilus lindianensis]|uniref:Uncharacterized protein n=1 Tax=Alkalihalophilus lindianensis TaxID=1630542 RepID=A0ABU3X5N3_9BACI|nr:hypothetical protein [Alkalihalophilus lindianensis]MDV2682922.1 hypothetical protein [Alkalihalophilus lindianensis]
MDSKTVVHYVLIAVFFFTYMRILSFIGNRLIPFQSSLSVLIVSVLFLILALVLSVMTTNKITDVLRSK